MFVAPTVQVPDAVPAGPAKDAMNEFLSRWKTKYGDRDANAGGRAWDSMIVIAKAAEKAKSVEGAPMRDAIETLPATQGAIASYNFSPEQHVGITQNPLFLATVRDGKFEIVK